MIEVIAVPRALGYIVEFDPKCTTSLGPDRNLYGLILTGLDQNQGGDVVNRSPPIEKCP
jgi:hypothetical protein